MSLNQLAGQPVYNLAREDFQELYCEHCKDSGICVKDDKTIHICMGLIDAGTWDMVFRKRQGD